MKEKNYSIEILRILSSLMVIVIHTSNYFCRAFSDISAAEYIFSVTLNALSRVSVPCFFMISGAFLLDRDEKLTVCLKRPLKCFLILSVASIFYYFFNNYYTRQKVSFVRLLSQPSEAHLWYLYVFLPILIMLPFLRAMIRGMDEKLKHTFFAIGFLWLIATMIYSCFNQKVYYNLPILGDRSYFFYFYLGYYIKSFLSKLKIRYSSLLLCFFAASLITIAATVIVSNIRGTHLADFLIYGSPLTFIASACLFAIALKCTPKLSNTKKFLINTVSRCTFGIYIIHIVFLDIYKMHFTPSRFSAFWVIPVLSIALFVLSFLSVFIFNKLKTSFAYKH